VWPTGQRTKASTRRTQNEECFADWQEWRKKASLFFSLLLFARSPVLFAPVFFWAQESSNAVACRRYDGEKRREREREQEESESKSIESVFFINLDPNKQAKKQQMPDFFTLELGPHSSAAWGATATSLIPKDLALGADFVFEQYREGVADRAAEESSRAAAAEQGGGRARDGRQRRGGRGGGGGGGEGGGAGARPASAAAAAHRHPVDEVLRELGLGEFASDRGKNNASSGFGIGGSSSAGDGREEEGARFLRLLRQAAAPRTMLQG
jgi:hypothetical protein